MNEYRYVVWVGGSEANDHLLDRDSAERIAASYVAQGYDDVVISERPNTSVSVTSGSFRIIDNATNRTLAILPNSISICDTVDGFARAGFDVRWAWQTAGEPALLAVSRYFIVHTGTMTVIDASECVVIDLDGIDLELDGDDYTDDQTVIDAAELYGSPLHSYRWDQCETMTACPVGKLAGGRHTFPTGSGIDVPWSVMGDSRTTATVCPSCAEHSEQD